MAQTAAAGQQQQQQPQRAQPPTWLAMVLRALLIYFLFTTFGSWIVPKLFGTPTNTTGTSGPTGASPIPVGKSLPAQCAFSGGDRMSLFVFLSHDSSFNESSSPLLLWNQKGLSYDWSGSNTRDENATVQVTQRMLANESVFAHIFLCKGNSKPRPGRHTSQIHITYPMTKFQPKPKVTGKKNLISGDLSESDKIAKEILEKTSAHDPPSTEAGGADAAPVADDGKWLMFWKPELDIRVLGDAHAIPLASVPEHLRALIQIDYDLRVYWPALFVNTFWLKHSSFIVVNDTLQTVPLALHFSPISFNKYAMTIQVEQQLRAQFAIMGGVVEDELDEMKRILTETNVYLLALTFAVSIVHSVFDFLAFKNDISFWRSRKSMAGLSVKTLMMSAVFHVIIFLYLLDNETSWMILISTGIGLLIELWKVGKAVKVSLEFKRFATIRISLPWVRLTDRESYTKSKTKQYDEQAMKYLSYALYPLVLCYAIYSLVYETHKSWYSFILGTLTGCVYTFGFIMMTPQLFINYKLRSVAHLPWRALVYKSLNTFVDDLFAFIIKMPTMHRIACFRDDIVFLIYVYQRWIYPVDKSRLESLQWEDAASDYAEQRESSATAAAAPSQEPVAATTTASSKKTD